MFSITQRIGARTAAYMTATILCLACLLGLPSAAHAESYKLDTGDVIRVTVFGEPHYPMELSIDDGGSIALPLLGEVGARGLTTSTLAETIRSEFEQQELIIEPFVQVEIREHRPFFISGAVARPGPYPYRPGITVRHALAIAGGFRALTTPEETGSSLKMADLRGDRAILLIEEYRQRVRLERLYAEIRDEVSFSAPPAPLLSMGSGLIEDIVAYEMEQLEGRRAAFQNELLFLDDSLSRARVEAEMRAMAKEQRELAADGQVKQLDALRSLRDQGLTTNTSLMAAERTQSSYRVDVADAEIQQARVQQEILNLEADIRRKNGSRKVELMAQIQDTLVEIAKLKSRLDALSDKLTYLSLYGEHRTFDDLQSSVEILIHRQKEERTHVFGGSASTPVMAGDLIEVSVVSANGAHSLEPAIGTNW